MFAIPQPRSALSPLWLSCGHLTEGAQWQPYRKHRERVSRIREWPLWVSQYHLEEFGVKSQTEIGSMAVRSTQFLLLEIGLDRDTDNLRRISHYFIATSGLVQANTSLVVPSEPGSGSSDYWEHGDFAMRAGFAIPDTSDVQKVTKVLAETHRLNIFGGHDQLSIAASTDHQK